MHKSESRVVPDYLFPPDDKYTLSPSLSFDHRQSSQRPAVQPLLTLDDSPRSLRKQIQPPLARLRGLRDARGHGHRKREVVKFGAVNPDDLSSDEDEDPLSIPPPLPARRSSTHSSLTLTNGSSSGSQCISVLKEDQEQAASARRTALRGKNDAAPEYSDLEEDVTNAHAGEREHRDSPNWKPPFLAHQASSTASPAQPVGAVPMTPSLIRAVDRIAAAQAQAYGPSASSDSPATTPGTQGDSVLARKQRWEAFWGDVTAKVAEGTNAR
jgi:hypothetical protein